ncbi:MAG: hypothetical protein QNJ51_21345 [Calothrix sp. MO_167.B12]|nr:hypothetical protein [Calothrix sp. MO_167.B12]
MPFWHVFDLSRILTIDGTYTKSKTLMRQAFQVYQLFVGGVEIKAIATGYVSMAE